MKSDTHLQSDVVAGLKLQPRVNAAHIGFAAKDNVITLTGQVAHYAEKTVAEDAVKGVYGVQAVANDIEVEVRGPSR